jgi:outer membrane protein
MKYKLSTLASIVALSFSLNASADDLLQVYQIAKIKDPQILQERAKYNISLEKVAESRSPLLPQINFSLRGGVTKGHNPGAGNANVDKHTNTNGQAKIALTQSIYNGAYWESLNVAEKEATQYKANYAYAGQDLLIRTSKAYFDVLRADDAVKATKANKRAVERQLEQTKQRFDVGLIAITDVHEAQAEYDRTTVDEIKAENALANAYYKLRELTGQDVLNISYLDIDTFSPSNLEGDVNLWRNKALEHNLKLHAQRIAKEVAKLNISKAQTGHGPTLDFTLDTQSNTNNFDNDYPDVHDDYSTTNAALILNLPIYTGGAVTSRVKQAQYGYVLASEQLVQTFRSTEAEVNSGYNNVRAAVSSVRAYEQTVKSSQSALEATEAGFEVGTRTIVDVLDATRNLYTSENQLANARYDYIMAVLNIKLSAGTLKEQDLIDISNSLTKVDPSLKKDNRKKP